MFRVNGALIGKSYSGSSSNPAAFIITCPDNLIVVNGMVGYSPADRSVNSTATYSCNDGFSLKGGNSVQHCQDTGQWNGTAPICGKYNIFILYKPEYFFVISIKKQLQKIEKEVGMEYQLRKQTSVVRMVTKVKGRPYFFGPCTFFLHLQKKY